MTTSRYYWFCLCATVVILHFADCNGSRGCPMLKCKACASGYKMARGCRTCECIDPCENAGIFCNETQRCKVTQVQCIRAPCNPVLECAPLCAAVRCSRFCASGYDLDSNGCQTCQCIDPCENAGIICNETQRCKETQVQCIRAPCDPILKCVPKCGPVCAIFCEYGNVLNENGCPTCDCKDPCKDLGCVAPKVCVPKQVVCVRAPCYPIPTCCTPLFTCKLACPNGYALDSDGCQICQCK